MDYLQLQLKEQASNKKCPVHPLMNCDMLLVDPTVNQHRICSKCMKERKILEKIISIPELMSLNPSAFLPVDPFIHDENLQELIESESKLENIYEQVKKYYLQLQNKLQEAIQKLAERDCDFIQKQIVERKQSQVYLSNMLSVHKIQQLLLSQDANSEFSLHEYILKHCTTSFKEIKEIKQKLDKGKQVESLFSLDKALLIQRQLLTLVDTIDLFSKNKIVLQPEGPSMIEKKWQLNEIDCLPIKKFDSSKNLRIEGENNRIRIQNIASDKGCSPQCYLNKILEEDKKYIISVTIYNQYKNCSPNFLVGLNYFENIENNNMYSQGVYYSDNFSNHINKIIKGSQQLNVIQSGVNSKFEFRICLKDKCFTVSSPPNYSNVCELTDKSKIFNKKAYCFTICIEGVNDSVTIENIVEVSSFNNNM